MTLATIERQTGPEPTASIIVLHGLGADGNDFVPICGELALGPVGDVRFVFPHAPVRPVTINGGYAMRAWYDILAPEGPEDEQGLRAAMVEVEALIAKERARGIADGRIVLMGFSQGCAMTLLTGLRHRQPLAGIAGLSGYLPLAERTAAERNAASASLPIFLAHGRADPVVPYERGVWSRDALVALGCNVEWHEYDMPHSVSLEEVADLNAWLLRVLARP